MSDAPAAPPARRRGLLPDAGAAGRPLSAAVSVVSLLAVLAIAASAAIFDVTARWTDDIERAVTIRVRGVSAAEIERDVAAVQRVLETTGGVAGSRVIDRKQAAELLSPWLGSGGLPDDFPVPALIAVEFVRAPAPDLELLSARVAAAAPGASLDDHRAWNARLLSSARAMQTAAVAVFALVLGAAAAVASFAARASLAANSRIVEVLHLMGATDGYIAAAVQNRLLRVAGLGAAAGWLGGTFFFLIGRAVLNGAVDVTTVGLGPVFWTPIAPFACIGAAIFAGRQSALATLRAQL
ncbi:MAG: hypothetical protein AAFV51_06475 [Pseudomonadota bacterium]